nr:hypothetical protein Iba_chr01bCG7040 [Ipomoea batatas]
MITVGRGHPRDGFGCCTTRMELHHHETPIGEADSLHSSDFRCTPDEVSRRMGPLPPRALLRLLCASFWYAPASFPGSWIALCVVLDDLNSSQNVESLNCEVSWFFTAAMLSPALLQLWPW